MAHAQSHAMSVALSSPATICGKPIATAIAHASALLGLKSCPIDVEVSSTRGPPFFQMVGLPDAAVREARVRVASALATLGLLLDEYAITVNLAPADVRKNGATLDLAIALSILAVMGRIEPASLRDILVVGELSLDGRVRPVRGLLPQLRGAQERQQKAAIVPQGNAGEAGLIEGLDVYCAERLAQIIEHLRGGKQLQVPPHRPQQTLSAQQSIADLADVRGQYGARRAMEIAAAGRHHLLMIGPPGSGKTMLAQRFSSLLPDLSFDEALEVASIHSVSGLLPPNTPLVFRRPFRAPHHSISEAALIGGGEHPKPGEITLAHHGVLFLDEISEFKRSSLESLRQTARGRTGLDRPRARFGLVSNPPNRHRCHQSVPLRLPRTPHSEVPMHLAGSPSLPIQTLRTSSGSTRSSYFRTRRPSQRPHQRPPGRNLTCRPDPSPWGTPTSSRSAREGSNPNGHQRDPEPAGTQDRR